MGFVNSWISPETTMVDAIVKMTDRIHDSTVVISTMQWSVGQLERLKDHFKRRKINAFIIGDLGIWFDGGGRDTSFFSKLADSSFHILPAFRTPRHFFNSHHVKGAIALTQDGDYIFTSSNLTSGDGTQHKELGITGKSKKFSGDLLVAISDLVAEYCTERRYASCNLVKFGKADFTHELELEEMIANTCKDFFKNEKIEELYSKSTPATRLISARDHDVNKTVSHLMGTAKQSIRGTIHELRHIPIIKDFIATPLKDKKIFLGENADTYLSEAGYQQGSGVFLMSQELPHAKAVLFDDRFLFWGSGNFTKTGFTSEREVYAVFTDRKVVEAYRKFYALFEKAHAPAAPQ